MRTSRAITVASLAVSALVVGCGADTPEVCGSVADLKASVDNVREIDVTASGAINELKSALSAVQSDLAEVKADAESNFAAQLAAVETSYDALKTSVESVRAGASAATLAEAASALSTFGSDVGNLITDIQATC